MSTTAADNFSTLPTEVGRAQIEYPFKKNGDRTTRIVKRTYKQLAGNFTPTALGSPDVTFSDHYLIEETDPQPTQTGLESFTRTYATIPTTQTVPSSVILSKPSLSGTFPQSYGSFRIFQPDTTLLRYDAYAAQTVAGDTGSPGFYPLSGTYTITFEGDTTGAIAYNATAGTVQTALNALASVVARSFVSVSGSYNSPGGFAVTFSGYSQITIAHSLTGGTIVASQVTSNGGYTQSIRASLLATKLAITIDTTNLIASGGTKSTLIDYSESTGALASTANLSRCQIYLAGYYRFTGGTYTITLGSYTTAAIPYDADLATIQVALDAVAPGLFVAQAWETGAYGPGGFYDAGTFAFIYFSIYFVGSPATGGSYSLSALGYTTGSITYNASAATVQTALNALAGVSAVGGCVVTGTLASGFNIAFANAVMTTNATSLTPLNSTVTASITDAAIGRTQKLAFSVAGASRDLTITAHGITVGDSLYLKSGSTYYSIVTNFTVPDANTIRLNLSPSDAWASIGTITECGERAKASYQPGSMTVACKRISEFYLPGITTGITTADDISIPVNQGDGSILLLSIFAGTGSLNLSVGELTQWRDGPILSLTKTTINAADV
jgi:hypothetical protein